MEEIILPVSRDILKAELTPERRLRATNKSNNEIYIVTYKQAPGVVREIGRLRFPGRWRRNGEELGPR